MCEQTAEASPLDALLTAIDRYCAGVEAAGRDPAGTAGELRRLRRGCDRLELAFSHLAAAFASTDGYDADGAVSPVGWLTGHCGMTGHAAASAVCVGRTAPSLASSVDAMREGRIGFAHLALLARTAEAVAASGATLDESRLLRRAERSTPNGFRRDCAHARHAADAAAFLAEQRLTMEARFLEVKRLGDEGCVWIRGFLDAAGGATLVAALEPLARREGTEDHRGRPRRLADALVGIAAHALDGAAGAGARQVPHLQVTATLETLLGVPGAPAGEVEGAALVSAATVERLACAATVRRVLLGPDSAVVDVGRARRLPAPATRRAVEHRDRGCVWPRCDRTVRWAEVHHLVHWSRGGSTDAGNLVLLCHRHHTMVHEGGWRILRESGSAQVMVMPPPPDREPFIRGPSPSLVA